MKGDTHPSAPLGSLGILSHLGILAADPGKHQDSLAWASSFWGRQVSAEGWPCTHRPRAVNGSAPGDIFLEHPCKTLNLVWPRRCIGGPLGPG